MTKRFKIIPLILMCLILGMNINFLAGATNNKTKDDRDGIQCISYRGDTALYEQNSKEAVLSAFSKGADFVSVNVREADDSQLVLCGENEVTISGTALEEILGLISEKDILILDFDKSIKDKVYEALKKEKALSKAYLRIKDSAKNLNSWILSKDEKPMVIGVSSSFNIFTIQGFLKAMAEEPMVDFRSKNYFNVMYGSLCCSRYGEMNTAKVIAPMYDPDLCGQRSDSEDGWNDLIKKNFSVIETNNLDAFISYKNNINKLKNNLEELVIKAEDIALDGLSTVSKENLTNSISQAKALISESTASSDELQSSNSLLLLSINTITSEQGEDTKTGALNITAGKITAAVLVGMLILAAQIFISKMQKEKKR